MFSYRPTSHFDQNTPAPNRIANENENDSSDINAINNPFASGNPIKNSRVDLDFNNNDRNLFQTAMKKTITQTQRRRRFGSDLTNTAQRLHSINLNEKNAFNFDTMPQKLSFQSVKPKNRQQSMISNINNINNINNLNNTNKNKQINTNRNDTNDTNNNNPFLFSSLRNTQVKPQLNKNIFNQTQNKQDSSINTKLTFETENDSVSDLYCESPEIGPNIEQYGAWEPSINKEETIDLEYAFELFGNYRTFVPSRPLIHIDFSDLNEQTPQSPFNLLPVKSYNIDNLLDTTHDGAVTSSSETETDTIIEDEEQQQTQQNMPDMMDTIDMIDIDTEMDMNMNNLNNMNKIDIDNYEGNGIDLNFDEIGNLVANHCQIPINDEDNELDSPFPQLGYLEAEIID